MAEKNQPITLKDRDVDALFMRNLVAGTMIKAYDDKLFAGPITLEQLNTLAAVGSAFAELTAAIKDEKTIEEVTDRIAMMKGARASA